MHSGENAQDYNFDSYAELLQKLLEYIAKLPPGVRQPLEKEVQELVKLLEEIRSARFMVIGRRGAGKSSLINAIFNARVAEIGAVHAQTGESQWYEYQYQGKKAEILDTRGILEGGKPLEADQASSPQESILKAIREKCPDIVLFLCKATEVDSAIRESLDLFEEILKQLEQIHHYNPPIVGIVTQCDQLPPADILKLPTDDEEKNQNINSAVNLLEKHLKSRQTLSDNFVAVIPIAAFVRYRPNGTVDDNRDYRWNIDHLTELLVEELPKGPDIAFARLARLRKFQKQLSEKVVTICTAASGGVAFASLPAADFPILVAIQTAMIVVIGYVSGRDLSLKAAGEFLTALGVNVGTGFALRTAARSLVKVIPVAGNVISGGVAGVGTLALGKAAIAYFVDNKPISLVKKDLNFLV